MIILIIILFSLWSIKLKLRTRCWCVHSACNRLKMAKFLLKKAMSAIFDTVSVILAPFKHLGTTKLFLCKMYVWPLTTGSTERTDVLQKVQKGTLSSWTLQEGILDYNCMSLISCQKLSCEDRVSTLGDQAH